MHTETLVEQAITVYRMRKMATIYKTPTPVQIQNKRLIKGQLKVVGYLQKAEHVDYYGTLKGGRAISFEVKETKSKTNFPLDNILPHQVQHLKNQHAMGAASFVIINFLLLKRVYKLDYEQLDQWIEQSRKPKGRKSIPIKYFEEEVQLIKTPKGYLDFLDGL